MRNPLSTGPRRTIRSVIAVLAALMLLVAACGGDDAADETTTTTATPSETTESTDDGEDEEWQQVLAAAEEEGRVVVYLALAGFEDRIRGPWQEAYPDIELEILREGTGSLITKLEQERDTNQPGGDVTIHSSRDWMDQNAGSFTPPAGPNVELWQDTPHWYDSYFTSLLLAFNVGFNPNVIAEVGADPITDWEDLLQPELSGLLGLTRPDVSPVYLQHFWLLDEELGSDFTEALAAQNVRLYDSAGPLSQAVASGELAAGINLTPVQSGLLREEGAPIEIVESAEPAYTIGYWAAQMEWATNPNAAAVFMNWLMSVEGQEAISDWGYSSSPLPEITSDYPLPDDVEVFDGILTPDQDAFLVRWQGLFL